MKVLAYLAERPGTVIQREEFLDNLWGSAFVGDAALTRCIYEIRAAFGDNPREPRIVETVPKIGFRLIAKPEAPRAKITFNRPLMTWATAASLVLMAFVLPTASIVETDEPIVSQSPALATYYKARKYLVEPTRIANRNAIAMFEKAIEQDPEFGPGYAGLANAISQEALFWGGQQIDAAYDAAMSAIRLDPDSPRSHNALGVVHHANGEMKRALDAFNAAIELDPAYADAHYNAGDVYRLRLDFGPAIEHYLAVMQAAPDHSGAMRRLGYLYLRAGDLDAARSWINRVIDERPIEAFANSQLATLEMIAGNTEEALEICGSVVELFPSYQACLRLLGAGSLKIGDYDAALHWFDRELTVYQESAYGQLGIAQVMLATGRADEGLARIDDMLATLHERAKTSQSLWSEYWMIAACLAVKGETDEAIHWLNLAADAGRRFPLWDAQDIVFEALHGDQRFDQYVSKTLLASNTPH